MSNFQSKLIKEYERKGYDVIKTIRLNKNGYPDLFLFKDGKAFFIESKESNDILSELQKLRISQLIKNGFDAVCLQDGKGQIYPEK
jgi:Holliday junction resolvase